MEAPSFAAVYVRLASTRVTSCANLELIPLEEDAETVQDIGRRLKAGSLTEQELVWALRFLSGDTNMGCPLPLERLYTPHCTARDGPCYSAMESPVVYGGAFYQALLLTVLNGPRIKKCDMREIPDGVPNGEELFDRFLYNHIPQIRDAKSTE